MLLNPSQRALLQAARDYGYADHVGGYVQPWNDSRAATLDSLRDAGLIDHNHRITVAGLAALKET